MCDFDENFRYNVSFIRQKQRITKKKMAEILGISIQTLTRMERYDPKVRIRSGMICRFCNYFEISSDVVLRTRLQ